MARYFENLLYTPQEIESMKANNERAQNQAAINAQNLSLGLNIAQNLSPLESLGFLLGNIGGQMYRNYRERGDQKKIEAAKNKLMAQQLGEYGQSLIPNFSRQNSTPQNDYNFETPNNFTTPPNANSPFRLRENYFPISTPQNDYNFEMPNNFATPPNANSPFRLRENYFPNTGANKYNSNNNSLLRW